MAEDRPGRCGDKRPKDSGSWWLNDEQYDSVAPCCDKPAGHGPPHWCESGGRGMRPTPGERVPLTDEQLDEWERGAEGADGITGGCLWWPSAIAALIAELRASRAREQELQQRIDGVLAACDQEESDDLAVQVGQYPGSFIETTKVRAALTGDRR